MTVEEIGQASLAHVANQATQLGAIMHQYDRRQATDGQAGSGSLVFIGINFGHAQYTGVVVGNIGEHGGQQLAGLAPVCAGSMANSSLSERAVYRLLSQGGYRHHCAQLRNRLDDCRQPLVEQLLGLGFGIDKIPTSGMYVCAQLPGQADGADVATLMLEQGHLMAPGMLFSDKEQWRTSMRFNVGHSLNTPALPALMKIIGR